MLITLIKVKSLVLLMCPQKSPRTRMRCPYTSKPSQEYLALLLSRLLDTIVMNRNYSDLRIEVSLEVLAEVRDMDMLAGP